MYKFIDLFSGIGGMRLAFESVGGKCVFSSEYDPYPASMYMENFGEYPSGDITKIAAQKIPSHDILVAGFPCQPFSIAGVSKRTSLGMAHGFRDKDQGNLFFEIARILEYHKPEMFLLENVKNLVSHNGGKTFNRIKDCLTKELGYRIFFQVMDSKTFVPQHRERIYIVGVSDPSIEFKFPDFSGRKNKVLKEILTPNHLVDSKYTLSDRLWSSLKEHARRHSEKGNGFGFGLVGPNDIARTLSARYYKDGSEILIKQASANPRRLTPKECALLMGFPKDFKINLSDTRAYQCFGNSVVVPVVARIAKEMVLILSKASL
jgi:DNA (cytosine-5)-methyltransferase 1